MTIISVGGFLGSGKTTLLLSLARAFRDRGLKTAIIENEIGEVPVDSALLSNEGFTVKELYSGCICCSLREDLTLSVDLIRREISPDVLLVEPSGIAGPDIVAESLQKQSGSDDEVISLLVIDYRRAAAMGDVDHLFLRLPFLERALELCDLPVINIPKQADEQFLHRLSKRVKSLAQQEPVILDAFRDPLPGRLADTLLAGNSKAAQPAFTLMGGRVHHHERREQDCAAAKSRRIRTSDAEHLIDRLEVLLKRVGQAVHTSSSESFGHLKAAVSAAGVTVGLNCTEFSSAEVRRTGIFKAGSTSETEISVNAIVHGLSQEKIEALLEEHWSIFLTEVQ